jgi:hypothetical protein
MTLHHIVRRVGVTNELDNRETKYRMRPIQWMEAVVCQMRRLRELALELVWCNCCCILRLITESRVDCVAIRCVTEQT